MTNNIDNPAAGLLARYRVSDAAQARTEAGHLLAAAAIRPGTPAHVQLRDISTIVGQLSKQPTPTSEVATRALGLIAHDERHSAWLRLLAALAIDDVEVIARHASATATLAARIEDSAQRHRVRCAAALAVHRLGPVRAMRLLTLSTIRSQAPVVGLGDAFTVAAQLSRNSWWTDSPKMWRLLAENVDITHAHLGADVDTAAVVCSCQCCPHQSTTSSTRSATSPVLGSAALAFLDDQDTYPQLRLALTGKLLENSSAPASNVVRSMVTVAARLEADGVQVSDLRTLCPTHTDGDALYAAFRASGTLTEGAATRPTAVRVFAACIGHTARTRDALLLLASQDDTALLVPEMLRYSREDALFAEVATTLAQRGPATPGLYELLSDSSALAGSTEGFPAWVEDLRQMLGESSWILSQRYVHPLAASYGYTSAQVKALPQWVKDDVARAVWNDKSNPLVAALGSRLKAPGAEQQSKAMAQLAGAYIDPEMRYVPPAGVMIHDPEGWLTKELADSMSNYSHVGAFKTLEAKTAHYAAWVRALSAGSFAMLVDDVASQVARRDGTTLPDPLRVVFEEALALAGCDTARSLLVDLVSAPYGAWMFGGKWDSTLLEVATSLRRVVHHTGLDKAAALS